MRDIKKNCLIQLHDQRAVIQSHTKPSWSLSIFHYAVAGERA